jgi:hypothetical protein
MNRMKISRCWLAMLLGSLLLPACVDPITVGADLLEGDRADVGYTDTLRLEAVTEPGEPLVVYDPTQGGQQTSRALFGELEDAIFGRNRASLYLVPRLQRNNIFQIVRPSFIGRLDATLDSIVLVLPTDTVASYGNTDAPHAWKITSVPGQIDPRETYRSDTSFTLNFVPEGQGTFVPNGDSLLVSFLDVPNLGDSVRRPHVRLPLDLNLGERILTADSTVFESDTLFQDFILGGLFLEPDGPTPGIVDFNLDPTWAGLHLYYTLDGEPAVYVLPVDPLNTLNPAISRYEQEYTGSYAAEFFNDFTADSLVFVEGMGGLRTRLELPDLRSLQGQVVNKADLDLVVRRFDGVDYSQFLEPQALTLQYIGENGELEYVEDIQLSLNNTVGAFFGGFLREDPETGDLYYRMSISVHLQGIIDGEYPPVLYLVPEPTLGNPRRTVLFGPSSTRTPVRLKVAFTRL